MGNQWDMERDDWIRRSRRVVDDQLMKDIVGDSQRGDIHGRASVIPPPKAKAQQSEEPQKPYTHGWVEPPKIKPPEGIDLIDSMVSAQDERDLLQRAKEMAAAQHARKMMAEAELQRSEEEKQAKAMGLSHADWSRMSEADLKARKEQQEKKLKDKGPQK